MEAIEHKEPDRVPIDLGGMLSTGITAIAYNRLKRYLGIKGGATRIIDPVQFLAKPEKEILDFAWADVLPILREPKKWKLWTLADGSTCEVPYDFNPERMPDGSYIIRDGVAWIPPGAVIRMPPKGYYFDIIKHPLSDASNVEDLKKYDWDRLLVKNYVSPYWETLDEMAERCKKLYHETDYALMLNFGGNIFETSWYLRGFAEFLIDLRRRPRMAEFIMDKLLEIFKHNFREIIRRVKGYIQIVQVGDDLGQQNGPIMSLKLYREYIKPRHAELYEFIKKESGGAKIFLHTCGSIYVFIEDLIEIGVDILNPIQVSAKDMDTKRLKKEFGDEVTFWGGGCDTQKILPFGTPEDVRKEVKKRIEDLAPGGGFVFCQVHNIQPEVPPENIAAMYEAVHEYGWYRK